ncbi:hypothetical protein [Microbacterium sp. KR10-403]|uniref:hypothetical protein n=1 Tax=Microbacterium sp. KR10-403 TaxID=3158581 RepID=UPI0032E3DB34
MDEHRQSPFGLETATIRELLVELERVEQDREREDCLRLRSRERMLTAELRRRRERLAQ